jgi:regulator of sigma E protease
MVAPNSPAQKAALKRGDRIEAIDGEPITSWRQLMQVLGKHKPGDKVEIKVKRKNIGRHLLIKGEKVDSEESLGKLMDKLKAGEKFEGEMVQSDTKTIPIVLGGQAP